MMYKSKTGRSLAAATVVDDDDGGDGEAVVVARKYHVESFHTELRRKKRSDVATPTCTTALLMCVCLLTFWARGQVEAR